MHSKTLFLHRDMYLIFKLNAYNYLYLLPFLLWYQSNTDMQECYQHMVILIIDLITGATLTLVGTNGSSLIT